MSHTRAHSRLWGSLANSLLHGWCQGQCCGEGYAATWLHLVLGVAATLARFHMGSPPHTHTTSSYLNSLFANVPFPVAQTTTTAPPTTHIHNPYKDSTTTRRGEFALFLILIGTQTFSLSLEPDSIRLSAQQRCIQPCYKCSTSFSDTRCHRYFTLCVS